MGDGVGCYLQCWYGVVVSGLGAGIYFLKSEYGDSNIGTLAGQQILLKIKKVHIPRPMGHS